MSEGVAERQQRGEDREPLEQPGPESAEESEPESAEDREPAEKVTPRPGRPRRRSRVKTVAIAVAALVAAGGVTVATLGLGGNSAAGGDSAGGLPPKTADVARQTLQDTQSADGELGHGPAATVTGRLPGTVTRLPDTGEEITRGQDLYEVDEKPVTLMYGERPAYRALEEGQEGSDVRQLEKNLSKLGYDGFTVDDAYTSGTADAVRAWQEDRGLQETGRVELGRVVFAPGAVRVEGLEAAEGDPASPGRKVLSYTGTDRAVTVALEPADQGLAKKGADVEVTLPDDTTVDGTVDEVSTVIVPGSGQNEEAQTSIEVVVGLKGGKAQKAAGAYTLASVDVAFTAGEREDVLTVPVAALVALEEGGFGVEVVKGKSTRYVPVTTGLFAGGKVEITGDGITEGTTVGMPK
ncbi:peptidoglycan-binding protein [Streptomyces longisporoflavus]|uniref:efflux RND transporter periplasmic adaptor subunit n=1 Tax=Streptomyces longisporoflavus TaxID=28044 RepID=UPI00167DB318|nr:peptidoglycan-binding protein [Streptomyces longisporoflavus]GGV54101.1 peptidoglycan-binding protein [Streptomyces longisporoflavus]